MKNILLLLLFIPVLVHSQRWEKSYGHGSGESVQQTVDGGYIVAGWSYPETNNTYDIYLCKADENGDVTWTKDYGGVGADYGFSVQQTADDGYIITGCNDISGYPQLMKICLIKTDENGDTLWTKLFGDNIRSIGFSVQQTTDGGYIVIGINYNSNYNSDIFLFKTDNNGDTIWTKTYGGDNHDAGISVKQTLDGGYVFTGDINKEIFLYKTDEFGNTLWTKTYEREFDTFGQDVHLTTDGGYIIVGFENNFDHIPNVLLIKTDGSGDTLWTKRYDSYSEQKGASIQQTSDGGYIIGGEYCEHYYAPVYAYLLKTDSFGDTLWMKTYGSDTCDTYGNSVQITNDGGYIITGKRYDGVHNYVILVKTDENGVLISTTEIPLLNPNRKIIKLIDLSGREISSPKKNTPYIEIYDDGTTRKKMIVK